MPREYEDIFIPGPSPEPQQPQPAQPTGDFGKALSLIQRAIAGVRQRQSQARPVEPREEQTFPNESQTFDPIPETQNTSYDPSDLNASTDRSLKTLGYTQNIVERFLAGATAGTLGAAEGIFRTPEAVSRVAKAGMKGLGVSPEMTSKMSPLDTLAQGTNIGDFHVAGFNDVADQIRVAQKLLPTLHRAFRQNEASNKKLNEGTKELVDYVRTKGKSKKPTTLRNALFDPSVWLQSSGMGIGEAVAEGVFKGHADKLKEVIADPGAWAGNIGNAVPSLMLAHASGGSVGFMGWMEAMDFASGAADFEKRTGIKITPESYTMGLLQQGVINAMFEKMGYDEVFNAQKAGTSKLLKSLIKSGFKTAKSAATEGFTEGMQEFNGNLAMKVFVDTKQDLLEGLASAFMGGFGSGGLVSAMSAGTEYMADVAGTLEEFNERLGERGAVGDLGPSKKEIAKNVNRVASKLFLQYGGKKYPVESTKDASDRWQDIRDEAMRQGAGPDDMESTPTVVDSNGRAIAEITWNGTVLEKEQRKTIDPQNPDIRYRVAKEQPVKDLVVMHNISPEGLLHADKMGGLAVPSLSIGKETDPLEGFGDITLIGDKELINPQKQSNKVFNADIYSPRYPSTRYTVNSKELEKQSKIMKKEENYLNRSLRGDVGSGSFTQKGVVSLYESPIVQLHYLRKNGIDVPLIKKEAKTPNFDLVPELEKFVSKYDTPYKVGEDREFLKRYEELRQKEGQKAYDAEIESGSTVETAEATKNVYMEGWYEDGKPNYNIIRQIIDEAESKANAGTIDDYAMARAIQEKIGYGELASSFRVWVKSQFNNLVDKERIPYGEDRYGNRKYLQHTLENVVRVMKKELQSGEGFNYGLGNLRASVAKRYRTIREIQADRDKILSKAEFEKVKEITDQEFEEILGEAYDKYDHKERGFGTGDTFVTVLIDGIKSGRIEEDLKEYGFGSMDMDRIKAFLDAIRNMPTEYFEAKIQRAVGLNEFSGAVVPMETPKDVLAVLDKHGIPYRMYSRSIKGDKATAIRQFNEDVMDLRFRRPTQEEAFLGKTEEELDMMDDEGKAFIAQYLPELVDHVKTPLLLFGKGNQRILGDYLDGTIRVQRGQPLFVWKHEAGHAFFDLFLSDEERAQYIKSIKKAYPQKVLDYAKTYKVSLDMATEEILMEMAEKVDSGQYVYNGTSIPSKIVAFLKEVIRRIRAFLGADKAKIEEFYKAFYSNRRTVAREPGFKNTLVPRFRVGDVRREIEKNIGIKDTSEKKEYTEAELLRMQMKAKAQAAKFAFREGYAQARRALVEKYAIADATVEARKSAVKDYINNNAPASMKRGLLSILNTVKTDSQVLKALLRVETAIQKHERKETIAEVKKLFKKADSARSIAVEYRELIDAIEDEINFKNRRIDTIIKIKKTKAWLDKKTTLGEDVTIPRRIYEAVRSLEKTGIHDMEMQDLYILYDTLDTLMELGRSNQANRTSAQTALLASVKKDILSARGNKIEGAKLLRAKVGEKLGATKTAINLFKSAMSQASAMDLNLTGMDTLFDILDGGAMYSGPWYRNFKRRMDILFGNYLNEKWAIQDKAVEMVKRLKLNDQNFERIGVYAANVQEGGRQKLLNNGITEDEIDSIKLNPKEQEYYDFMRSNLDELFPKIKSMMAEVYNEELGQVKNYFSFMTDFDQMNELEVALRTFESSGQTGMKNQPNLSFTEERKGPGKQKILINAHETFIRHVDNAVYAINMAATTKMLDQLLRDEDVLKATGDRGATIIRQWLDLMNRKGGVSGQQQLQQLDFLRKNLGIATLGFKLSSAAKQPLALLNGAELIGHYAFRGAAAVASDPRWRKLVSQMPEIRERVGDDPAFTETSGVKPIKAVQQAGMAPLRFLDSMTAAGIAAGAYMSYMDRAGKKVDFNNVDEDAIQYAQQIVRRSQSTSIFKDVPLAVSRGKITEKFQNRSLAKTILQFQTFMLSQWNILRHDLPSDIANGRSIAAAQKAFFFASAVAMEMVVSNLSKEAIQALFGGDDDDEDEEFVKKYFAQVLQTVPFASQAVSAATYGSIPVPVLSYIDRLFQNYHYLKSAKKPETRAKWAKISALETVGGVLGVPGTVQLSQIIRKKKIKKSRSSGWRQ